MPILVRNFEQADLPAMTAIWNQIVAEGNAFPQTERLSPAEAAEFFASQSCTAVAEWMPDDTADSTALTAEVVGLYVLHPNNIGRCGHIANASFAVDASRRGLHIGEALVRDCLIRGRELGFRLLQFNAVVSTNTGAIRLYERLGFNPLGTIPGGFLHADGHYLDICLFYKEL